MWFYEDRTRTSTYRRLSDKEYRERDERRYFLQPEQDDLELSHWSWDPEARGATPVPVDSLPTRNDQKHRQSKVAKLSTRLHPDDLQTWLKSDYKLYPIDLVKARDARDNPGREATKHELNVTYSALLVRYGISM